MDFHTHPFGNSQQTQNQSLKIFYIIFYFWKKHPMESINAEFNKWGKKKQRMGEMGVQK
jgi:hypothetical protein